LIASILAALRGTPQYQGLIKSLAAGTMSEALGLPRATRLPVLAALHSDLALTILLVTDRADRALSIHDELGFWVEQGNRYHFAEPNPLFYENAAWGSTTRRERLQALHGVALHHLPYSTKPDIPPILTASVRSLMTRTIPRREYLKACQRVQPGKEYQPETLMQAWLQTGYQREDTVLEVGQFSHRGGLLDIWPPAESVPLRLDFFGNELETIRSFDPGTQRTLGDLETLVISPAREFIQPSPRLDQDLPEHFSEFDIPLLHTSPASLLDYLPKNTLVVVDDTSAIQSVANEVEEHAIKLRRESIQEGTLEETYPVPYVTWSELEDSHIAGPWLELGYSQSVNDKGTETRGVLAECFGHDERFAGRLKPFIEYLSKLVGIGRQTAIISRQSPRLKELWLESGGEEFEEQPEFMEASVSEGFTVLHDSRVALHLFTDSEIFGWERPQPRLRQRQIAEAPESLYADLLEGDYVVHIDHGIGRFAGLVQRQLEGHEREFLSVVYDGGDTLYVPVHQADRLTRYLGPDGGEPSLDNLGSQAWQETTKRVRQAVREVAQELLDLYARRQVAQGHSFSGDGAWQKELEDSFPYVETEDQARAIKDIKRDMQRSLPMDRLLCGDVGYGKTEVALRAAFKAVMDNKQVAMLVPTTVLAQQHFETFCQRLAAFPVKVEMLSRFRSPREQTKIINDLALGEVDIVIGTHRLISSDVQFLDLGLVIIDEEQRFGVTHKEHLKRLRTEVDVLTLTATPIPRTLYMALTGVRDISNLNTPPEERLAVITHVGPYSQRLVRQAILRELERGGQVFFVHNRVHTINAMRAHLKNIVPEARVGIAHGQMPEQLLAKVMHQFNAGEIDVLLSTSIIESGLDIPNANTLIVDRADTFGLAQLYQLRGRVGRGAMRAYAYFFRHRKLPPTIEGQQRLEVIAENTQLGSGYSIAMRDLEIRGAGELLGTRQHGHIQAIGFHLYTRMLGDAVRRIRAQAGDKLPASPAFGKDFAEFTLPMSMPVNVDLPLQAGIPPEYIADQELRLRLYRRIADLRDESEIDALELEFKDRFGTIPDSLKNLFFQMQVKLLAERNGLASVSIENGQIILRYPAVNNSGQVVRLRDLGPDVRGGKNAYWLNFGREPDWPVRLLGVLEKINDFISE
jgi:transcription-repair coupling factor (superfamily II helicase)